MYCNIVLIFCVFICTGHVKGAYQKKDFLGGVETFFGGHTCACMQHVHSARTVQGGYNSALGGHRELPKVANERYGNIVLIFCVFLCTCACACERHLPKKIFFLPSKYTNTTQISPKYTNNAIKF